MPEAKPNKRVYQRKKTDPSSMDEVIQDSRFSKLVKDPRFKRIKKDQAKIIVDDRFKSILQDDEGASKQQGTKVDKYGRKVTQTKGENMKRFYRLDKQQEEEEAKVVVEQESLADEQVAPTQDEALVESDSEEEEEEVTGYELARGGVDIESSSDEESDAQGQSDESEQEEDSEKEDIPTGDATTRLAIVNLDWDHVKAKDIFKLFEGFVPAGGALVSVIIYPSEFGKERMAKEAIEGPPADIFEPASSSLTQSSETDFNTDKLREYQLSRLRYYYAIATFDSVASARAIYEACDGVEFENSGNFLDLRYVPQETTFDDAHHDKATEAPTTYSKSDFVTRALQHSSIKLTWDEDDDDRVKMTRRKFTKEELQDMDFKAYLASSSSESESDNEGETKDELKAKYRSLLQGMEGDVKSDESEVEGDMEITFTPGLSEAASKALERKKEKDALKNESVFEQNRRKLKEKKKAKKLQQQQPEQDDDALVSDNEHDFGDDSFFVEETEQQDTSKKSKKKQKKQQEKEEEDEESVRHRAELELLMMSDNPAENALGGDHFDAKDVIKAEKQSKSKKRKYKNKVDSEGLQNGFELDIQDDRFKAIVEDHDFAIDPTNPKFKKTTAMEKVLKARRDKSENNLSKPVKQEEKQVEKKESHQKADLDSLVAAVKRKSKSALTSTGKRTKLIN